MSDERKASNLVLYEPPLLERIAQLTAERDRYRAALEKIRMILDVAPVWDSYMCEIDTISKQAIAKEALE